MPEKALQNSTAKPQPASSVFAKEKTYGEKKYNHLFGTTINFWVNLFASAGFTFWVNHSTSKVKLPFVETALAPREVQQNLANWLEKTAIFKMVQDPTARAVKARSNATLFTLLTPGHIVMIPSVWLGSKYKSTIVKYFDRKHYGEESMQSEELKARHDAIDQEDKPTFVGAVVGRLGSMLATQTVGFLIGTKDNLLTQKGIKDFPGIDSVATHIGDTIGTGIQKIAPETSTKINTSFSRGYSWSEDQLSNTAMHGVISHPYTQAIDNFSRYVTTDVLYTLTTSVSVNPIINFAKKFIPGLTYKVKQPTETQPSLAVQKPNRTVFTHENEPSIDSEAPISKVSSINHESTLQPKADLARAQVGG